MNRGAVRISVVVGLLLAITIAGVSLALGQGGGGLSPAIVNLRANILTTSVEVPGRLLYVDAWNTSSFNGTLAFLARDDGQPSIDLVASDAGIARLLEMAYASDKHVRITGAKYVVPPKIPGVSWGGAGAYYVTRAVMYSITPD